MKILITYLSHEGDTKKMAQDIFKEIQGVKEIKKLNEVETVKGYDLE